MDTTSVIESVRSLESQAGRREAHDPSGDSKRAYLRRELDRLALPDMTVAALRAVCVGLGRNATGKSKAGLVEVVRRVPLERIEILHSADS